MDLSIAQIDYPAGMAPDDTEFLLGLAVGLDGNYGQTFLVRHDGALKALHRGGMVGSFEQTLLQAPPRLEPGKWGDHFLVLSSPAGEHRLELSHSVREDALLVLEPLYYDEEAWSELAALLEGRLELLRDDAARCLLLAELGTIYCQRLADLDRAVAHFDTLLVARPDNDTALTSLEGLVGQHPRAAELLESNFREHKRHERLVSLLLRLAELEPQDSARLLEAVRVLSEELAAPDRALSVALRALALVPGDDDALALADALAARSARWSEAAAGYRQAEQNTEEPELDVKLLSRVGAAHHKAGELEPATHAYVEILWLQNDHQPALCALNELFEQQQEHKQRAKILLQLINTGADTKERIEHIHQLGLLYEQRLDDVDRAIEQQRRIVELDPSNKRALKALCRLHRANQSWPELLTVLERRVQLTASPEQLAKLHARCAKLAATKLDDQPRAIDYWSKAFALNHGDQQAADALDALLASHERYQELLDVLEKHAAASELLRAVALLKRAAHKAAENCGDELRALSCYQKAAKLDPTDREVLRALQRHYQAHDDDEALLEVLDMLLALSHAPDEEVELRLSRAQLYADQSGDLERAIEELQRVLALDSQHAIALETLVTLCCGVELYEAALTAIDAAIDEADSDNQRIGHLLRKATVLEQTDLDAAIRACRSALRVNPAGSRAFEQLERLLQRTERHAGLVKLYERRAKVGNKQWAKLLCKAATLAARELGDGERALAIVTPAVEEAWRKPKVITALITVATTPGGWLGALDLLEKQYQSLRKKDRRVLAQHLDKLIAALESAPELAIDDVVVRLAEHFDRVRNAPKRALSYYQRARDHKPTAELDNQVGMQLRRLGLYAKLAQHLQRMIDSGRHDHRLRFIKYQLAELLEHHLDDAEKAAELRKELATRSYLLAALLVALLIAGALILLLSR